MVSIFITQIQRAAIAALFVTGLRSGEAQVGDGHLVEGGHNDAAGDPLGDGLTAVLRVGLVGDLIEMEVHRPFADAEDGGDLPGGFALAGPEQALLFPIRQLGQVSHQIGAAFDQLQRRVEDVAGAKRQQGNVFKHQIGVGFVLGDE